MAEGMEMDERYWIRTKTAESRALVERVTVATRLSTKLSDYSMDQMEAIQPLFEELIGKPVGEGFTLIPPFYTDYGLNIAIGKGVFIGHLCAFTGHAPLSIADGVMIAHKVNLITAGHPVEPERRKAFLTAAPITIGADVWIGAAATILPGVTIGEGAVIGAGSVVTRDVAARTVVVGNPARVARHL